jgi:hypothetical protein
MPKILDVLDDLSLETLKKIRTKTPEELRSDEIAFLKARFSYLTLSDKDKFASVLKPKKAEKKKEKK